MKVKRGMMQNKKLIIPISFIFALIDQIIKMIVSNSIKLYDSIELISNFLYLTFVKNKGAAWSIFSGERVLLILISLIGFLFVIWLVKKEEKITNYKTVYYSLLLGGIVGNFIDRIIFGYVIDYIDTYIFGYNFPIFNLADSLIFIGVFMILIENFIKAKEK